MGRTILASGLSLFLFAVPALAADPASGATSDKTATVSAESTGLQPTLSAAIAAEAANQSLTVAPSTAVVSDWHQPKRPAVLPALYVGSALLQAFDAYSTTKAISLGGTEANPMMKAAASNPAAMIGVKAGVTTLSILAAERMWKNHNPTGAILTMVASNGFMAWVAMHNASVISGLPR
jgi:hypothetical protein